MPATITAIATYLPERVVDNAELLERFPDWSVAKVAAKTGIDSRHVAAADQFSSDLGEQAIRALQRDAHLDLSTIDYLIVCTQTPDHIMPSVSSSIHGRLGLASTCGAIDINQGCSGYVYGLGLASALLDAGQARRILLVTADTYTKLLNATDRSVLTLFGDGATASLLEPAAKDRGAHSFTYGSDGARGGALVVPNGGLKPAGSFASADPETRGLSSNGYDLFMDGPAIFDFTLRVVPETVDRVLSAGDTPFDSVDTWVFHQANAFMLGHLRRKLGIPVEKFVVEIADVGNTVSSTIPIALERSLRSGVIQPGSRSVLIGFGVGLSWGGAVVDW